MTQTASKLGAGGVHADQQRHGLQQEAEVHGGFAIQLAAIAKQQRDGQELNDAPWIALDLRSGREIALRNLAKSDPRGSRLLWVLDWSALGVSTVDASMF